MELDEPSTGGQLILNLRAEASPDELLACTRDALSELILLFPDVVARLDHEEHFRPGRPTPTHRDGVTASA
jgi:hypothetical protein